MRIGAVAFLLATLSAASVLAHPYPSPSGVVGPAITRPTWIKKPSRDDFIRAYPPKAAREGIPGHAVLNCQVEADGHIDCRVASEAPPGYGFGAAALSLQTRFQMRPVSADGHPVQGGHVNIPIRFDPPPHLPTPAR